MKVLGYFVHRDDGDDLDALTAIIVIDTGHEKLTGYCGAEQHFQIDKNYFAECRSITKEQYILANRNFYTPAEYLEEAK